MASRKRILTATLLSAVGGVIVAVLLVLAISLLFQRDGGEETPVPDFSEDEIIEEEVTEDTLVPQAGTRLYFVNTNESTNDEEVCDPVLPLVREVTVTDEAELLTLLLSGPTLEETREGFVTVIPQRTSVVSLDKDESGRLTVTLSRGFYPSFCARTQAELQIKRTLTELEGVSSVVVRED